MGKVISQSTVRFRCPHCGKMNKAPIAAIGRGGSCAKCGGGVEVPAKAANVAAGPKVMGAEQIRMAGAHAETSGNGPLPTEDRREEVPAVSTNSAVRKVESLEDLSAYLAATPRKRLLGPRTAQRTPCWLWVLHLALPVATLFVVAKIIANRMPAPAPPPVKLLPPQPIEPESPARSS